MAKSYKIIAIAAFLIFALSAFCFSAEEKITITTFYPSPYGSYNELNAIKMKIGETYSTNAVSVDNNNVIVEGRVGIGTATPIGLFQVGTFPSSALVVTVGGNVGIGTSSPTTKLEVAAPAWIRGSNTTIGLVVKSDGKVGVNTNDPKTTLDVNGGVKIGGFTTCDPNRAGTMRYNETDKKIEFCDGNSWKSVVGGGGGCIWVMMQRGETGYETCDRALGSPYICIHSAVGNNWCSDETGGTPGTMTQDHAFCCDPDSEAYIGISGTSSLRERLRELRPGS